MAWISTDPKLFFTKNDPQDPRLGEMLARNGKSLPTIALWGYPDDDGIRMNGGRWGASDAPDHIRKYFYKLTPPLKIKKNPVIVDEGNLHSSALTLPERHQAGSQKAEHFTKSKTPWLSLGGGHDYGYADGSGFLRAMLKEKSAKKPVIINFDAHLDVRPIDKGYHSGTPFFRLLEEFSGQFDFFEVGIQSHCNSKNHIAWLEKKGGRVLTLDTIQKTGLKKNFETLMKKLKGRPLLVSLDIDALKASDAPGCSQSWPSGLSFKDVSQSLDWLGKHFDWRAFSIYEVSPPLDVADLTSKAAALYAHQYLTHQLEKNS